MTTAQSSITSAGSACAQPTAAPIDYYGVGIEHFAVEVDRREEVEEAHARCLASGASIHFPPEEDRDLPGYYAFFAFDPDGVRVEVFCWPRGLS